MSRFYEIRVTVWGHHRSKEEDIKKAASEVWTFEEWEPAADDKGKQTAIWSRGQNSLCAGVSEEELARDLTKAIRRANGSACRVTVDAIYLEDLPFTRYQFDEVDREEPRAQ